MPATGQSLIAYLAVALGSAAGGVARYACGLWAASRIDSGFFLSSSIAATLFVNVSGSFLIGIFAALTGPGGRWAGASLLPELLMVGLMGGYTTFSAFSLQTLALLREGRLGLALANVAASVVLCLIAVWLGYVLGNTLEPA